MNNIFKEIFEIIKGILKDPPGLIKRSFIAKDISKYPKEIQVLACVRLGVSDIYEIFDNRRPEDITLASFISKQYNYMNDLMVLVDSYNRDGEPIYYKDKTCSIWSIGSIASAMVENLLLFAWISDEFSERSKCFYDFYPVQDLDLYPTGVSYTDHITNCIVNEDDKILESVKKIADTYKNKKKKNLKFDSDEKYLDRNNYINEWYKNNKGSLSDISTDIKLQIVWSNQYLNWPDIYSNYRYLCSFKHISIQNNIVFGNSDEEVNHFENILRLALKSFIIFNRVLICIYDNNKIKKDESLLNIEKKINELLRSKS